MISARLCVFLGACAAVALARSVPASLQEQEYLKLMKIEAKGELGGCDSCGCEFCCLSSCDSRCGAGSVCNSVGCVACDCVAAQCITALREIPDTDFCTPDVFTVTLSSWDARKSVDASMRVIRKDKNAGWEREDIIDAQFGGGDVRRGYIIRAVNGSVQWNVTEDGNGIAKSCAKTNSNGPAWPDCIAEGAHYTGGGTQGGVQVSFWRQLTGPNSRVDLVMAQNTTDISGVMRVARVSSYGFSVDEVFNFNTNPIPASTWVPPSICP